MLSSQKLVMLYQTLMNKILIKLIDNKFNYIIALAMLALFTLHDLTSRSAHTVKLDSANRR